jgi:surface polysaccharide O-acyltransferase-like enzyme
MKKYWVTNLRVSATLMVILLHAAGFGVTKVNKISISDWWICHVINSVGRFAVPIFVMLSGYLLLGRYENLSEFLRKRISRIFIPFLIWSLVYMLYANFKGLSAERTPWELGAFIKTLLVGNGGGAGHLWFVYMLLGLYAFTPIISRWIRQATETEIVFFLILWVLCNTGFDLFEKKYGLSVKFDFRYFTGYLGYFVLGYWLGNKEIKLSALALSLIFLSAWAVVVYVCYVVSFAKGQYTTDHTYYLSLAVMLMSASIFLWFKKVGDKALWPSWIAELDASSYGMYLVHFLILRILSRNYRINYSWHHPLLGIIIHFLLCAIVSYLIVKILSKIPKIGNWLVG